MPQRKEAPKLKDLCIENMARNIEAHSELFKRSGEEKEIYIPYKIFQSLFTDDLLEKVSEIHSKGNWDEEKRKKFLSMVISDGKSLLLNEHATCLFPKVFYKYLRLPQEVFSYIASHCKNLRSLNVLSCRYLMRCWKPHLELRNLRDLDFGCLGSDEVLMRIFQLCPFIREISATPCFISDSSFLSLCKHKKPMLDFMLTQRKMLFFCPENGACCKAGKHLQKISIVGLKMSETGVACALQHLPQLREFNKFSMKISSRYPQAYVLNAIMRLQNHAADKGIPKITLQLGNFHFDKNSNLDQLRHIAFYCPKVESVQLDLYGISLQAFTSCSFQTLKELSLCQSTNEVLKSPQFKQFLAVHCETIQVLNISSSDPNFDLTYVNNILRACYNLKQLHISTDRLSHPSYQLLPPSIDGLERVELYLPHCTQPCVQYFYQIFCKAGNIKYLSIGGSLLPILPTVVEAHGFRHLEELILYKTETSDLSLVEKLMTSNNSLKKISFVSCKNQNLPVTQISCNAKEQIRQNNYDLEISFIS